MISTRHSVVEQMAFQAEVDSTTCFSWTISTPSPTPSPPPPKKNRNCAVTKGEKKKKKRERLMKEEINFEANNNKIDPDEISLGL